MNATWRIIRIGREVLGLGRIIKDVYVYMGVSKNNGTPKSSILIWFSIINHPFWGTPIFGNTHIDIIYILSCSNKSTIFTDGRFFLLVAAFLRAGLGVENG